MGDLNARIKEQGLGSEEVKEDGVFTETLLLGTLQSELPNKDKVSLATTHYIRFRTPCCTNWWRAILERKDGGNWVYVANRRGVVPSSWVTVGDRFWITHGYTWRVRINKIGWDPEDYKQCGDTVTPNDDSPVQIDRRCPE